MFHTVAYFEDEDTTGGVQFNLDAVPDDSIFTSGEDIRVPNGLNQLIAELAVSDATTPAEARIESPSLRQTVNQDIEAIADSTDNLVQAVQLHPQQPRQLRVDEAINFVQESANAGAIEHWGAAWLADGPIQPVQGQVFTVRATAAIQQVDGAWVSGALAFSQTLGAERYQVVGVRARAATGVVARLIFVGSGMRPGVPMVHAIDDVCPGEPFRYGRMGVWGEFNLNQPPTLEVLGGTAAAQVVLLDLIRVG